MRRALAAAFLVALMAPTVASAQPTAVEGGGSFNDAPILTPGAYSDTIRPGENLYYAVELAAGQRVRAKASIRPGVGDVGTDVGSFAQMQVYEANREKHFPSYANAIDDLFQWPLRLGVRSDVAGDPTALTEAAPGVWYVELSVPKSLAVRRTELRLALEVEVTGQPVEQPTPTATPEPSPTDAPTGPGGSAAPPGGDDGRDFTGLFLAMFLLGLLGGSALEVVRGTGARP